MVRVRSRGLHYAYDTKTVQNISVTTVASDMRFLCNIVKHEKRVDCLCSGGQWEHWAEVGFFLPPFLFSHICEFIEREGEVT